MLLVLSKTHQLKKNFKNFSSTHASIKLVFSKFFSYKLSSLSSQTHTIGPWQLLSQPLLQVITTCCWLNLLNSSHVSPFNLPPPLKCRLSLFSTWTKVVFFQLFYKAPQYGSISIYSPYCGLSDLFKMQIYSHVSFDWHSLIFSQFFSALTIKIFNIIFKAFHDLMCIIHTTFSLS